MAKKKEKKTPIQLIEEEYTEHNPLEDDELFWLKEALTNALNPLERKIFLSYVEAGTYAATAKYFKVSTPTLSKYINTLRMKITQYVADNYN